MAVNRQVYTIPDITITAAGAVRVADLFRQLLIDAGLMSEWHDSWSVANNNNGTTYFRVLKLTQDATKAYGITYALFSFYYYSYYSSGIEVYVSTSTGGWNATSHVPTGTQYLDYHSVPSGSTGGADGRRIIAVTGAGEVSLVRYTSGNTTIICCGSTGACKDIGPLILKSSIDTQPSWVDLNKVCVPPVFSVSGEAGTYSCSYRTLYFYWLYQFRRMVFPGRSIGSTAAAYFTSGLKGNSYTYSGFNPYESGSASGCNDASWGDNRWTGCIHLPWSDGTVVPGASAPWAPILTNIEMASPLNMKLPSDFAISTIPSMSRGANPLDRLNISDTEVWEVITSISGSATQNSMVFLARIV